MRLIDLIEQLPKTELHLHIEGTLEPELMWALAEKHGVSLPYDSVEAIKAAYQFDSLQSFLDLYYQGADVLRDEEDFYQLMRSYLQHCHADNIVHTEIMFDPQTHTERGVGFDVFMPGFQRAIDEAKAQWGISVYLIMSFLRHLSEAAAIETLNKAREYYPVIKAVGLDSSEQGNPPEKFVKVFTAARALGFKCVAHAGEEGPPDYIWQALDLLKIDRVDHGVRAEEDEQLIKRLRDSGMALTVCPQSNIKLCVFDNMAQHNILDLLEQGLCVTVNSDDPSYFGGYLNDNYKALMTHLAMNETALVQLVKNSFIGSFLPAEEKNKWLRCIDNLVAKAA